MNNTEENQRPQLTSWRPHHIRATLNWIRENNMRPMILVAVVGKDVYAGPTEPQLRRVLVINDAIGNADASQAKVYEKVLPTILLNLSDDAVAAYRDDGDGLRFKTRFNFVAHDLYIPFDCIVRVISPDDSRLDGLTPLTHEFVEKSLDDRTAEQATSNTNQEEPVNKLSKSSFLRVVK